MPLFWEWVAFYRISPWGDPWRRAGRHASIVAAAAGAKVESTFEDKFMPTGGKLRDMNQTEVEMLEKLRSIDAFREDIDRRR
jgi:hypothetical protein